MATVDKMWDLFDNYDENSRKRDPVEKEHTVEQKAFLEAVIETEVMKILTDFLKQKSTINSIHTFIRTLFK